MRLVDHLAFLVSHADLEFLPLQNPAKVAGSPPRIVLGGSLIGQRHPLGVEDLHRIDDMEVVAGYGVSPRVKTRRRATPFPLPRSRVNPILTRPAPVIDLLAKPVSSCKAATGESHWRLIPMPKKQANDNRGRSPNRQRTAFRSLP